MKDRVPVRAALALTIGLAPLAASAETDDFVNGLVTKIDGSAGKITIKHGPIKEFDMEPMTMVFRTTDPVMLKAGRPCAFRARAHQRPVHDHEDRKSQVKTEPVTARSQPHVAR